MKFSCYCCHWTSKFPSSIWGGKNPAPHCHHFVSHPRWYVSRRKLANQNESLYCPQKQFLLLDSTLADFLPDSDGETSYVQPISWLTPVFPLSKLCKLRKEKHHCTRDACNISRDRPTPYSLLHSPTDFVGFRHRNHRPTKTFIHRRKHTVFLPRCPNKTEAEVLAHYGYT